MSRFIPTVKRLWEMAPGRLLQRAVNLARSSDQIGDENLRQRETERQKQAEIDAAAVRAFQARTTEELQEEAP
jgi:hypothetical protein